MKQVETIQARLGLAGNKTGTEKGPEELASRLDFENYDNLTSPEAFQGSEDAIRSFCLELADSVENAIEESKMPLVLGGDHSVAIGSMNGAARDAELGVIWIDAHADFNTPETSPSGNVHGMPVAAVTGHGRLANWVDAGVKEENVSMIGIRDVDEIEEENLEESDVNVHRMEEISKKGMTEVAQEALDELYNVDRIHVSFDIDFLDAGLVSGVGTPVEDGGSVDQAVKTIRAVMETGKMCSMDVVELNPDLDDGSTAEVAEKVIKESLLVRKA